MNQDQKSRLAGLFFIVSGAVLGYLAIWSPYQDALRGAARVSLNRSGIALAILFPMVGIVLAAGGEALSDHLKAHIGTSKTRVGWTYIAVCAAIALGTFFFVESRFEALGYTL